MPKIFEYFGFVFLFYSNEHEPVHVHVLHGDRQTVFELILTDGQLTRIGKRFPAERLYFSSKALMRALS